MCQGLSHFSGFLHNFVLVKIATSSTRVKHIIWISFECLMYVGFNDPLKLMVIKDHIHECLFSL